MNIPFVDLTREANYLLDDIKNQTELVIKSGQYINGPKVKTFEEDFAEFCGVKYAISVGNGSDGLTFIMKSLNIGEGDSVICPANSFIASAWSIVATGAMPIFCDVGDDMLINIENIKKVISPSTKAIMAVHLTGKLCDNQILNDYCKRNNLFLIEDAAQAVGAEDNENKRAGSFGIAASFSLHPLKNLSLYGDGGIITTNNLSIANNIKLLRNHGLINRDLSKIWGYNSRLDELQAAYALVKMKNLDKFTKRYISIASKYSKYLSDDIIKPKIKKDSIDVFHNYVIRVSSDIRDLLMNELKLNGIETKIHYPVPLHLQECSKDLGYKLGDLPNVEKFAKTMISLPIYPLLEEKEIEYIIETFNKIHKTIK